MHRYDYGTGIAFVTDADNAAEDLKLPRLTKEEVEFQVRIRKEALASIKMMLGEDKAPTSQVIPQLKREIQIWEKSLNEEY